jgi:hypothetical protein
MIDDTHGGIAAKPPICLNTDFSVRIRLTFRIGGQRRLRMYAGLRAL